MPSQTATTLTQNERKRRGGEDRSRSPTLLPTLALPAPTQVAAPVADPETPCPPGFVVASAAAPMQGG
eukprot:7029155-Prorocentrum_lima.AAC.1